jgi:hypothetical protein
MSILLIFSSPGDYINSQILSEILTFLFNFQVSTDRAHAKVEALNNS